MRAAEPWELLYYRAPDGQVPFREWLCRLPSKRAAAAAEVRLDRLRRGLFGDCRPVGDGVLELRIDLGPGYRGYFARAGHAVILLLHGGDKRTQGKDIAKAKELWRDYEKRVRIARDSG